MTAEPKLLLWIFERGATPWRFGRDDYAEATTRLPADRRPSLTDRPEATPWDENLKRTMTAINVAVHEEAIVDLLLRDLG